MTDKLFESYKEGKYKPYNRYYIETFKSILIPTFVVSDEECWFGLDNKYNNLRRVYLEHYSKFINVNDGVRHEVSFDGDYIIFKIYPRETIRIKNENGSFRYKKKYLDPYEVKVHHRNIKAFY